MSEPNAPAPVVAVVGRPNVGKSTLVNRILGRREAVVEDTPGVTRDRVAYEANWAGRRFVLLDTGGWQLGVSGLDASISAQAEVAVEAADLVIFVVDATVGALDEDEQVVRILRRAGKPVILAANKVDDQRGELEAAALWSLGLGEPYAVSALHGRGSGDLLDAVLEKLPDAPADRDADAGGPRRVALVGRPNVGKSSLLNKFAGVERALVDSTAGTTRDPVDQLVTVGGTQYLLVDTAGIRRRGHEASGAEYYSLLRTRTAIENAEVAVVLIDAADQISDQDGRVVSMVIDAGRALVLAYNKWDLVDDDRRKQLEREIDIDLARVAWAPRVNISAQTGRAVDKLGPAIETALASWETRVPTSRLNQLVAEIVAAHPHPVRGGKQPKILFVTQAGVKPPTFVFFTSGPLDAGYERFLERRLREEFGFEGTPVRMNIKVRAKRRK